jgi:CRISPR/Cas system-associated protein endoribonuclease Cas2
VDFVINNLKTIAQIKMLCGAPKFAEKKHDEEDIVLFKII